MALKDERAANFDLDDDHGIEETQPLLQAED